MSQPATAPSAAIEERPTSFKPANDESVPGGTLVIAAYAIVWVVVLLLVVRVFQRQSALIKRVEQLEGELAKKGSKAK